VGANEPTRVESKELDDQQRRVILERLDRRDDARAEVRAWLDNDCKAFEQAWLERWNALHAQPPGCLYHYTTADGLRGIFESQTLWATDARFLNDTSELSYANAIIAKVAAELIGQCGATIQQTFLNAASLDLLDTFKRMFGTYVVSFCGERNLLSQWRAYAPGAGYALGFDSNALKRSGSLQRLRPIIYEQAEQKALVEEVLAFYVRELERFERGAWEARDFAVTAALDDAAQILFECIFCFKHPGFHEEKEWRLVHIPLHDQHRPLFRTGNAGLIPYVELRPYGPAVGGRNRLPIVDAWFGPHTDPSLAEAALRQVVEDAGYEIPVNGSDLPVRVSPLR